MAEYKWLTPDQTMIAETGGNHTVIIEPIHPHWPAVSARGDIAAYVDPTAPPPVSDEERLEAERANMSCSKMQGVLALGEDNWNIVLDYYETASWAERVIIDSEGDWQRMSENIAFFGFLLGFEDKQIDDLFRAAALIRA